MCLVSLLEDWGTAEPIISHLTPVPSIHLLMYYLFYKSCLARTTCPRRVRCEIPPLLTGSFATATRFNRNHHARLGSPGISHFGATHHEPEPRPSTAVQPRRCVVVVANDIELPASLPRTAHTASGSSHGLGTLSCLVCLVERFSRAKQWLSRASGLPHPDKCLDPVPWSQSTPPRSGADMLAVSAGGDSLV